MFKDWQPTEINESTGHLVLKSPYDSETYISCSEGDTLFIGQNTHDNGEIQHVAITRHELYDIIFNFMNSTELIKIVDKKIEANHMTFRIE